MVMTGRMLGAALAIAAGLTVTSAAAEDRDGWSGKRALDDIVTEVSFGRRSPDMPGHAKTIDYIVDQMGRAGARIIRQTWTYQPKDRPPITLTNLIARFDEQKAARVLVGTHYDSLSRAYADAQKPDDPMPGANNSASGVAVLLETARFIASAREKPPVGVDFVFFDGEEGPLSLGAGDPDWFALGSPYFVQHLKTVYPQAKPLRSAIFDMVCSRDATFFPEHFSMVSAPADVRKFWARGAARAPTKFSMQRTDTIGDDQVALAKAGIPSLLVIGFEYQWFNTTEDTPDKCSGSTLESVGRTLVDYLYDKR